MKNDIYMNLPDELKFKAEDFKESQPIGMSEIGCIDAARIANALLAERFKDAEKVYMSKFEEASPWYSTKSEMDTHEAILCCVKKIGESK